ncbi:hypothetical protein [Streptomyces rimosus]|uniref:hypothetical protein n=1 Tax=Streptomyces rimosus TaxID=1927 RepID=UPI0037AC8449
MAAPVNAEQDLASYRTLAIEGCDGAGKSTLARRLATQHGFTLVHCPPTPDHLELTHHYRTLLDRPGRLILDRCFLSELVYGPLFRGRSRLTWQQTLVLAAHVTQRDGLFIHITATPPAIRARLMVRDGHALSTAQITALICGYHRTFAMLAAHVPVLTIDTTTRPSGPAG